MTGAIALAKRNLRNAIRRAKNPVDTPKRYTICRDCRTRPVIKYFGLGICHRCYQRRRRGSPISKCLTWEGPCRVCRERRGRGRSGMCKVCYCREMHRRHHWQGTVQRLLGTKLTMDALTTGLRACQPNGTPESAEALRVVRTLLWEMQQGNVFLSRKRK